MWLGPRDIGKGGYGDHIQQQGGPQADGLGGEGRAAGHADQAMGARVN